MPTEQKTSWLYIGGKRIGQMREIAEEKFGESFLDIKIKEGLFIIRVADDANLQAMEKFTDRYKLCKIEVFPRIAFCVFRGKRQLMPAKV